MDDVSMCEHTANVSRLAARAMLQHCHSRTRQFYAELKCLGSIAFYDTTRLIRAMQIDRHLCYTDLDYGEATTNVHTQQCSVFSSVDWCTCRQYSASVKNEYQ